MTLGDFRAQVMGLVEVYGVQTPATPAGVNASVIGPGLRDWCRRTECLRSDRVRWAPVAGRGAVRLDDPPPGAVYPAVLLADPGLDGAYATPVGMVAVRDVWWAGLRLDHNTPDEWDRLVGPRWAETGAPRRWRVLGGELHVHPAPDAAAVAAAGPNAYLSGAYSHPAVVAASPDAMQVLVPDEQLHHAARLCAAMLRRATATGEARAALDAEIRDLDRLVAAVRVRLDAEAHRGDPMVRGPWLERWGATFR